MTGPQNPGMSEKEGSFLNRGEREKQGLDTKELLGDLHVGDFVELFADGGFFQRDDDKPELYAGYVTSINNKEIRVSPTHPNNRYHGYVAPSYMPKQVDVGIEIRLIKEYRKFE